MASWTPNITTSETTDLRALYVLHSCYHFVARVLSNGTSVHLIDHLKANNEFVEARNRRIARNLE